MTRTRFTAAAAGMILTAAVLLSGCSANDGAGTASGSAAQPNSAEGGTDAGQPDRSGTSNGQPNTDGKAAPGGAAQPSVTRAIIKSGSLTIETADVDQKRQAAITIVTGLRGLVSSEDTGSDTDGRISRANLVLKVPTAAYETAIQRLSGLGVRKQIRQETSDVTEQVVDVESRISSQRASLTRMRVLLEKATTIGEIVSVETELTRREADLESLLAKQKALAGQTELATLSLSLVEPGEAPAADPDNRGFLSGLSNGWDAFTTTVSALATVAGALLPFLVAFALIGVPLWYLRRRFRRTPALAPAVATAAGPAASGPPPAGPTPPNFPDRPNQT
jgi:VIT1/CCC1 family predicted Fe2+/Mn2+ transporter